MSAAIFHPGLIVAGQTQAASQPDHVRVERHDQPRRCHARPDAEVYRIAPYHPPQVQVQPLARAARRRPREEVARRPVSATRHRRLRARPRPSRGARSSRARGRRPAQRDRRRPGRTPRSSRTPAACAAAPAAAPQGPGRASTDARGVDRGAVARRLEVAHERRRMRPHDGQQRLDRLQHAGHAPERQRGRHETDDFPVRGVVVTPDEVHRVGRRVDVIERLVERIERRDASVSCRRDGRAAPARAAPGERTLSCGRRAGAGSTVPARRGFGSTAGTAALGGYPAASPGMGAAGVCVTTRPPTIVAATPPRSCQPSNGVFFERQRIAAASTRTARSGASERDVGRRALA